eukprot:TRINITY_DN6673_c0_g1_i2.p3 TRINITY_DN6673_c0_g1~~TRINITY_DN6673_c0_g1_i2.p3  ORF type:complete len:129 (+),score=42.34 TRINITY_DN6673_c0_g1_i2:104-490(+)
MIRRPPRSTQGVSSAASDVYKRQVSTQSTWDKFYIYNADQKNVDKFLNTLLAPKFAKKVQGEVPNIPVVHIEDVSKDLVDKRIIQIKYKEQNNMKEVRYECRNIHKACLLYTSPSPRDLSTSRMPSSA